MTSEIVDNHPWPSVEKESPPPPPAKDLPEPMWAQGVASSFSDLATQFAAVSQALSLVPAQVDNSPIRITAIEQAQKKIEAEIGLLRGQVVQLLSDRSRLDAVSENSKLVHGFDSRLTAVEKKLDEIADITKLDQKRLYARMHNATISANKMPLMPLVMANGKLPAQFPATKGEFEHLTRERYDHLLKSYGLSIQGENEEKREVLREFIGLSSASRK